MTGVAVSERWQGVAVEIRQVPGCPPQAEHRVSVQVYGHPRHRPLGI